MTDFFNSLWKLVLDMAPYLLLGFFIAGLLYAFIPQKTFAKHLKKTGFKSVLYSTLLGVPLPLCSCGVLPTTVSLRRSGASRGACTSFLISTPQTGVDSILATYSLLGLPFAIIRPIAALITGLFGGIITDAAFKGEAEANAVEIKEKVKANMTFTEKLKVAFKYAFGELLEDVGKWLVVGLLVSALITVAVPNDFFATLKDYPFVNMLIVLAIAVPMYTCATGSIPIAVALIAKGMTPGAAFVLLMAGPAINTASMLVINKTFGKKQTTLYIASIIAGALAFGLVMDYLLPSSWFAINTLNVTDKCCGEDHSEWFSIACSILFLIALIRALIHSHTHGHNHGECHCHDEKDCTCGEHKHNEVELKVKGMCCSHCANNVKEALLQNDEVKDVDISVDNGSVKIEFKENMNLSKERLKTIIESVGYEVVD